MKIKPFTPEELEEISKQFEAEQKERQAKLLSFYQSLRFKDILNKIKHILNSQEAIGDNVYQEPLFDDVSNEEFIEMFCVVFNSEILSLKVHKDHDCFYQEYVVFEGLKFLEIHGQGTAFIVSKAD